MGVTETCAQPIEAHVEESRAHFRDTFWPFENGRQGVKMNFYPPCAQADKVIGFSPHFDINGLNLILQVNDVQGLQFKKKGKWVPVKPVSAGAFIVNIGDAIEVNYYA